MGNLMPGSTYRRNWKLLVHRAKEEFESEEGKQILSDLGVTGEYEGIGHCILGYPDEEIEEAKPRKDDYVFWVE